MKLYDVTVSYRPRQEPSPRNLFFQGIEASSARVALNRAIQSCVWQKRFKDNELQGAWVREVPGEVNKERKS